jgi:hypothetical protein
MGFCLTDLDWLKFTSPSKCGDLTSQLQAQHFLGLKGLKTKLAKIALHKKLKYGFIYLFAYSLRKDKPICTKLCELIPWDQEENTSGWKLRKCVMSSIPWEGVFCSSETKHDRRIALTTKLSVAKTKLQKQTPQHRKMSLVRVLTRKIYVAPELSTREEQCQHRSVRFGKEITGAKITKQENLLGSSFVKDFGFRNNFSTGHYSTIRDLRDDIHDTYEPTTTAPTI